MSFLRDSGWIFFQFCVGFVIITEFIKIFFQILKICQKLIFPPRIYSLTETIGDMGLRYWNKSSTKIYKIFWNYSSDYNSAMYFLIRYQKLIIENNQAKLWIINIIKLCRVTVQSLTSIILNVLFVIIPMLLLITEIIADN